LSRRRAVRPCLFCGSTSRPSGEHVIPKWVGMDLGIKAVSEERIGSTRRLDALSIVLPQVCVRCNTGWMSGLEQRVRPVLSPMLLGPVSPLPVILNPARQGLLATWAVKTSLLLTYRTFKKQPGGWIPNDNLKWLYHHRQSDTPPPGARVWVGGVRPRHPATSRNLSASAQSRCLLDSASDPVAHIGTFSLGHVLCQVFCCEQHNSDLCRQNQAWLAPAAQFESGLIEITTSSANVRWPPDAVFATDAVQIVGNRIPAPPPELRGRAQAEG
jgi:hypothetical protein